MTSFTPTEKTRVRRKHDRGRYDCETVFGILDAGVICHIGYVIDGEPYVTPTAYWREGDRLYWHGSSASRMLRTQSNGLPVCATVTHLDGFVLARSGFHHSLLYRSVMAFGYSQLVTDADEKRRALDTFIERLFPGRSQELRPIHAQELKATALVGMTIEEASAKVRDGGPIDEEEDYAFPCWAGVVPVHMAIGKVMADARLMAGLPVPANLAPYRTNARLDDVLSKIYGTSSGRRDNSGTPTGASGSPVR